MSGPGSPEPPSPESTPVAVPSRVVSHSKSQLAVDSLAALLGRLPDSVSQSEDPSNSLLHNEEVAGQITSRLREPHSGAGDDNLCRWLYDTFHTSDPTLQLVVLRFLPTLCGVYLLRAVARKPLPGFEAVLLALYAHETKSRNGHAVTVTIPDVAHPSLYHETTSRKNNAAAAATELRIAVVSPSLEPHGTVRATKRARIVGVALELYYSKISLMPLTSKSEFCEFCRLWSGDYFSGDVGGEEDQWERTGRVPLPWELLQPSLRILGHCVVGPMQPASLREAAAAAVRSVHSRAMHEMHPQAILATQSLMKSAGRVLEDAVDDVNSRYQPEGGVDGGQLVVTTAAAGPDPGTAAG